MATGRCCREGTTVSVSGGPARVATCHCNDRRRRSGSAFGWSADYPEAQVTGRAGALAEYHCAVDQPQVRWFCDTCGTTIGWRTGRFQ